MGLDSSEYSRRAVTQLSTLRRGAKFIHVGFRRLLKYLML